MAEPVLISICIPAYKHLDFLKRLLDSISIQSFRDFEVVITDDSPGDQIQGLIKTYGDGFQLNYHRNPTALGTPENWNEAIRRARGRWIKLMHDDDWFSDRDSLSAFAEGIQNSPGAEFIFSAYENVNLESSNINPVFTNKFRIHTVLNKPVSLLSKNIVGPPSVLIHRADRNVFYDKNLKWLVDIDFYMRFLFHSKAHYIQKTLVRVGIGKEQVTMDCFRQRPIEIPENFYLLKKIGIKSLGNIFVYDAWWRLIRNLEIRNKEDILSGSGYDGEIPKIILSMISWQSAFSLKILRMGLISKCIMLVHYIFNIRKI